MVQRSLFLSPRSEWQWLLTPADVDKFLGYANEENLEAVPVAVVTEEPRLVLYMERKRDR